MPDECNRCQAEQQVQRHISEMYTLNEVLGYLNNYFVTGCGTGDFRIGNGMIAGPLPELKPGQYFHVSGSVRNDGVHHMPRTLYDISFSDSYFAQTQGGDPTLHSESFSGEVCSLAIPQELLRLIEEISEWKERPENQPSALSSESFDGYSYTRQGGQSGRIITWINAFGPRLRRWRRL